MAPAFRFVIVLLLVVAVCWWIGSIQTSETPQPPPSIENCAELNLSMDCNP